MTKTYKGKMVKITDMTDREFQLSVVFLVSLWAEHRIDFSVHTEEPFKPQLSFDKEAYEDFVEFENTQLR